MLMIVGISIWIACAVLVYGLSVYHFQVKFAVIAADHAVDDRILSAVMSIGGPLSLFAFFTMRAMTNKPNPKLGWML